MPTFGDVDYCLFFVILILSGFIGLYSSYFGIKSPEEFLMGNRSLKTIPVAMSLLTSYVTAISFLGYSGEAYAYGTQLSTIVLGISFAILFSIHFALPVLHPLKLTSVNEYINLRFKSKKLQMVISFISLLKFLTFNGVTLYASTIAFPSALNLDSVTSIYLLGIVCTVYSAFGGIRGIIWSDIFQLIVILIGLTLVFAIGSAQNGGIMKTFYISYEGGRLNVLNMNPSPFVRHTFINTVIYGFFSFLYLYSSNQINIQRVCSVKSIMQAKRVLTFNIFGMFLLHFLIFSGGLAAYASYVGCDPLTLGLITKSDEIMTFFVSDKLSFVPGFSGLFFATLVGGSLSTLSSAINACVALIWRDICLRFSYFQKMSSGSATLTNKILSFVVGAIIIGLSILSSKAKSLIEITMTINGTFQGPVLGVFLIGYFFPKCNIKGVWTGFLLSLAFSLWLSFGSFFYKRPPSLLPLSVDECDHLNITSAINNTTFRDVLTISNNITEHFEKSTLSIESFYQISTTLFGAISTSLCILLAVVASFLTGNQNICETSPEYITPCLRKYYWSMKDQKTTIEEEKIELNLND